MVEDRKLLIAGAGGYIGTALVTKALESGRKVTALDTFYFGKDKLHRHFSSPRLTIVEGDIRSISVDVLRGVQEVINVAGISNDPACDLLPELTVSINRDGCIRFAQLAKDAGVERFIDMSSCSVYGRSESDICDETTAPCPVSLYARCKLGVEEAVLPLATKDFCIISLRNATTFGSSDRMRFDLVVNIMTFNALLRGVIKISGDGEQARPLIHLDDVVTACLEVLEADPQSINGQIFNMVGCNATIVEIAERVRKVISEEVKVEFFSQDFDIRNYRVDGRKMREILGIVPTKTIEEGVKAIVAGLKSGRIQDSPDCYTVSFYKRLFSSRKTL